MARRGSGERRRPAFDSDLEPSDESRRTSAPAKRKTRRRSAFGRLMYWTLTLCVWGVIGTSALVAYYAAQLPPIDNLTIPKRPPNVAIVSQKGILLANRGGGGAVHLDQLPPYLPQAFIAIEDRRFYQHGAIDPLGIVRALVNDLAGHHGMQGGSTLTQQLAKNLFLTQERTISRKIQEAILAIWLEHKFSKKRILELYLNRVYFGSGAFGVEAAAEKYFGRSARNVTLAQAAMLAGLMAAPSRLAPNRNPKGAAKRAAQVIIAMAEQGYISETAAKRALAHPAHAIPEKDLGFADYAADYVMDRLADKIGAVSGDLIVATTLSAPLQRTAQHALTSVLDRHGKRDKASQGALVALAPDGAVRALVGGRDYAQSQFNRAVAARRQPGSAFKPFVYLTALERGFRPNSICEDAPIDINGWRPEDFERRYLGPVSLTKALALSLNTVAVRLGLRVGPAAIVRTAHRLGITSKLEPNASIALGTSEVTPLELVSAYAPFANGGLRAAPYVITQVRNARGIALYRHQPHIPRRVIAPRYVAMMNAMMEQTLAIGTARHADVPRGWEAAGKTGTSQDFRDAWFVGYTSHLVTGVWVGNDDNSPTRHVTGGSLPVRIWSRFMDVAHAGLAPVGLPDGIWRGPNSLPPADTPVAGNGGGIFGFLMGARPAPARYAPQPLPGIGWRGGNRPRPSAPSPGRSGFSRRDSKLFGLF